MCKHWLVLSWRFENISSGPWRLYLQLYSFQFSTLGTPFTLIWPDPVSAFSIWSLLQSWSPLAWGGLGTLQIVNKACHSVSLSIINHLFCLMFNAWLCLHNSYKYYHFRWESDISQLSSLTEGLYSHGVFINCIHYYLMLILFHVCPKKLLLIATNITLLDFLFYTL